jgi:hypothetical protein
VNDHIDARKSISQNLGIGEITAKYGNPQAFKEGGIAGCPGYCPHSDAALDASLGKMPAHKASGTSDKIHRKDEG